MIESMEGDGETQGRIPPRVANSIGETYLELIGQEIEQLADSDLSPGLQRARIRAKRSDSARRRWWPTACAGP